MRYYFIDQDRNEQVIDMDRVVEINGVRHFYFNIKDKKHVFQARKLAGKTFGSWDGLKWFKLTALSPGETLVSHATTLKVYRGYKPSGLFDGGAGALVTQMPGKIVKLMVKVGDKVEAGQTVLILEAMKMENEIKAGVSGIVKSVNVEIGQALESGVLLVEIDDEAP